eukprot:1160042-Pelagomonas_calceolata.AAC.2
MLDDIECITQGGSNKAYAAETAREKGGKQRKVPGVARIRPSDHALQLRQGMSGNLAARSRPRTGVSHR